MPNHEWARTDAKSSHELARTAAQAAILLNGTAALAELAFLSSLTLAGKLVARSLAVAPICLWLYVIGAALAALALLALSQALSEHLVAWLEDNGNASKRGCVWWTCGLMGVFVAIVIFIVSSSYLILQVGNLVAI